jgi:hypothetical protein
MTSENNQRRLQHTTQAHNKHNYHGGGAACPSSGVDFDESMPPKGQAALRIDFPMPLLQDFTRFIKLM